MYLEKQKIAESEIFYEGKFPVSTFMQDLVRYLTQQLKNEESDRDEDIHSSRGSKPT